MKENPVTHICSEIIDNLPKIKDEESLKRYLEKTPSWATPIAPDFGEPWMHSSIRNCIRDREYVLRILEDDLRDRSRVCVNACAGMSDPVVEVTHLKNWKKEMSEVERTWSEQAVGKLLNMPLDVNIRQNIYPAVAKLRADLETAENTALRLAEKADAMREMMEDAAKAIRALLHNGHDSVERATATLAKLKPFLP